MDSYLTDPDVHQETFADQCKIQHRADELGVSPAGVKALDEIEEIAIAALDRANAAEMDNAALKQLVERLEQQIAALRAEIDERFAATALAIADHGHKKSRVDWDELMRLQREKCE